MKTWKDIACERLAIPRHAKDSHVLDEIIRSEIEGGNRLLQIRDQLSKLLYFMRSNGTNDMTDDDCRKAMQGITHIIQVLRTAVAERYRAEAEGCTDVIREDFQPPANYTDSKIQGT